MQSEFHRNEVCLSVELLVPMLFQLAIPESLLIFEASFLFTSLCTFAYPMDKYQNL